MADPYRGSPASRRRDEYSPQRIRDVFSTDGGVVDHPIVELTTFGGVGLEGPEGAALSTILRQPKSLAVLVYLEVETLGGFCLRDRVVAVFWPELDQARARAALRNTLYSLRRGLPPGVIQSEGDEALRVVPSRLWSDAAAFHQALSEGRDADALAVYQGEFMPGFHLTGSHEFEAWRDAQHRTFLRKAREALIRLAADENGDVRRTAHYLERAVELAPADDEPIQRLISHHLGMGNRGAALGAYRNHQACLERLDLHPSEETAALFDDCEGHSDRMGSSSPLVLSTPAAQTTRTSLADAATAGEAPQAQVAPNDPFRAEAEPSLHSQKSGALRGRRMATCAVGVLLLLAAWGARVRHQAVWAETEGFRNFRTLAAKGDLTGAFSAGTQLRDWLEGDEEFEALWEQITIPSSIRTSGPPAVVSVKDYRRPSDPWIQIGTTPIARTRIPATHMRWRIEPANGPPVERAGFEAAFRDSVYFHLPTEPGPPGMLFVSGDAANPGAPYSLPLAPFWLDRAEVTNADFERFVVSGAYRELGATPGPGPMDHASETAVPGHFDRSGRPGPATWIGGTYPPGQGDQPVRGVSWFEAESYCRWVGKELPTVYHWYAAGGYHGFSDILEFSNFAGHGATPADPAGGIGPYGHLDLAGNVREWAANDVNGRRFVLGGAWDSPPYLFYIPEAVAPWNRSDQNGFRCAVMSEEPDHRSRGSLKLPAARVPLPVAATATAAEDYTTHYEYDVHAGLEASVDSASDALPHWRREYVSFRAAYGSERASLVLFLPKGTPPPFRTVVFHPGSEAGHLTDSRAAHTTWFDFLGSQGYAVAYPVYKGTYERQVEVTGPIGIRDQVIQRVKDLRRSVDYLDSREDVASGGVVFYGFSEGGVLAPIFAAVEPRIIGSIVLSGGLLRQTLDPLAEPRNFLGLATTPLLQIAGEHDFLFPFEEAQLPFFEAWGAPDQKKRLIQMPFGHAPRELHPVATEVRRWLSETLRTP